MSSNASEEVIEALVIGGTDDGDDAVVIVEESNIVSSEVADDDVPAPSTPPLAWSTLSPSTLCLTTSAASVPSHYDSDSAEWQVWTSATHPMREDNTFDFNYADNFEERILVLEGEALLTPTEACGGGEPIRLLAGDAASFRQGFSCVWTILSPVRKRYAYFDAEGNLTQPNAISCDGCGTDCWEESYFMEAAGEDYCVACYKAGKMKKGEHQRLGVPVPTNKRQKR
jgi:uncharacterized cupin superfamily protein